MSLADANPPIQLDVDATAMVQAGLGAGYAQQIVTTEINDFLSRAEGTPLSPVNLVVRIAFNPNVTTAWFTSVMGIINSITMLAIILAGAAVVREREHGTMDHLLVMPLTPFEIAMSKIWANGLVITVAVGLSLYLVVRGLLGIPIAGSIPLFMLGVAIYLFFATAIGIFLGTVARSMPQLGLLYLLVFLPMNMLSGSNTPLESMPPWLATHHAGLAVDPFRVLRAGDPLSRRWVRRGVAAVLSGRAHWRIVLRHRSLALPQGRRSDVRGLIPLRHPPRPPALRLGRVSPRPAQFIRTLPSTAASASPAGPAQWQAMSPQSAAAHLCVAPRREPPWCWLGSFRR